MRIDSSVLGRASRPLPQCSDCAGPAGSSHGTVWSRVKAGPYTRLPRQRVTLSRFFRGLHNRFLRDARRTLVRRDDLLPPFEKLIRPNGICLSGTWRILHDNRYSGFFAPGSEGLLIARASVALSETRAGHHRAFGLAGKLYPTLDPRAVHETANFFVIDDNGGTRLDHYADAEMTNLPRLSWNARALAAAPLLSVIALSQRLADSHPGTRQLYPIAALGSAGRPVSSPRFLMVRGRPGARRAGDDFRDQLRATRSDPLAFDVLVRDDEAEPFWPLGEIVFDDHAASPACDCELHFAHPPWRRDLP